MSELTKNDGLLFDDIDCLIQESKKKVATIANSEITLLFWNIGSRINQDVLGNERAEYGKQIVATLSRQLVERYGKGYDEKKLRRMMQFAKAFPFG